MGIALCVSVRVLLNRISLVDTLWRFDFYLFDAVRRPFCVRVCLGFVCSERVGGGWRVHTAGKDTH